MSMSYGNLSVLHPNYLLPVALERLQGKFVGNFLIPEREVDALEYSWYYYGRIGGMTPKVDENDPGRSTMTEYEKRVGRCDFYRETTPVSKYATKTLMRNAAVDASNYLADRMALRLEYMRVTGIKNGGIHTSTTKDYLWKDCDDDDTNWIGGTGPVNMLDDILDAIQRVSEYAKVVPDTLLCGTRIAATMKKSIELRQWDRAGPLSQQILLDGNLPAVNNIPGSIGRIAGLEVFETNSSILSDADDETSDLEPLLSDDVFIFKRGVDLGALHIFEGVNMLTEEDRLGHSFTVQIGFCGAVNIFRPQFIYKIANAIA